jgi:hypothetical protein
VRQFRNRVIYSSSALFRSNRNYSTFRFWRLKPQLNIGVNIGFLARYFKKNLKLMPVPDFTKQRGFSILWGLSRDVTDPAQPVTLDLGDPEVLAASLLKASQDNIVALGQLKQREQTWATVDSKGHMYEMIINCGTMSPAMAALLKQLGGWTVTNSLPCTFAPYGMHLPLPGTAPVPSIEQVMELIEYQPPSRPGRMELSKFQQSLDPAKKIDSLIALGGYTIERSHYTLAENDDLWVLNYLATTHGYEHGLDGYATHSLIHDKRTRILYFRGTGEGKHVWRTIDGINNPVALFVFSVMARSFFRFLELASARSGKSLPALDLVRDPETATAELRQHIATADRELARDRRRARLLDFLGEWLPQVRYFFGANVVQAPLEVQLPGGDDPQKPGSGGSGTGGSVSGGSGTGGSGTGGALVAVSQPKQDEGTEEARELDPDDFPIWPFAVLVSLLARPDDESDDEEVDEDDIQDYFVDMSTSKLGS